MTCPICKHGKMDKGFTTLILEDGNSTIAVKKSVEVEVLHYAA